MEIIVIIARVENNCTSFINCSWLHKKSNVKQVESKRVLGEKKAIVAVN